MVHASRFPLKEDREHHESGLAKARLRLAGFPRTRELVKNLSQCKWPDRISNIFFILCLNDDPQLAVFETFLSNLEQRHLSDGELSEFRSRSSGNSWQSLTALQEALITQRYEQKVGAENVEFHPQFQNNRFGDVAFTLNDRKVFCEITSLGTTEYELEIEEAFDDICKTEVEKLGRPRFVELFIDLARITKDAGGHVGRAATTKFLETFIDQLKLRTLFDCELFIKLDLDRVASLPYKDMTVYEHAHWRASGREFNVIHDPQLARLVEEEPARWWAKNTRPLMVADCPISHLHSFDDIDKSVPTFGIQARLVHPSRASEDEKRAFLSHLRRVVDGKLGQAEPQIQPGAPNILAIMAHNWLSHDYPIASGTQPLGPDLIQQAIHESLAKSKNPDLSCVRLYEWNYDMALTIPNPFSSKSATLTQEEIKFL